MSSLLDGIFTGSIGPRGPVGPAGPTGPQGPTGADGGGPATQLVFDDEGPVALDLATLSDGQVVGRIGSVLGGVDLPTGGGSVNLYVDKPATPHADDDEFDNGSPDLAERGYIFNLGINGNVGPMIRVGEPLWHGQETGMSDRQYRSKIVGSKLFIQFSESFAAETSFNVSEAEIRKAVTGSGFFVARGSSCMTGDASTNDSSIRGNLFLYVSDGSAAYGYIGRYSGPSPFGTTAGVRYIRAVAGGSSANISTNGTLSAGDVYAMNCGTDATSLYTINSGTGENQHLRYPVSIAPAYTGFFLHPGSNTSRRIFEIDYIRRYPYNSWFGA